MVDLSIKLNYSPAIFQEAKHLSKCVMSCELKAFVIGCLHLDNLCSGNVILVQYEQIQEIGWESRPNREN